MKIKTGAIKFLIITAVLIGAVFVVTYRLLGKTFLFLYKIILSFTQFCQKKINQFNNYLMKKSVKYRKWNAWEHHGKFQYGVLALYSFVILGAIFSGYRGLLAISDLFDTWNFTTASNYNIDAGLQTNGSSVELKPQNYTSDANTSALYHFDEINGSVANDSSANSNTGTVYNSTFGAGILFNGLNLANESDYVSAADSPSLSLTQSNTLESWMKFTAPFSASSDFKRQSIIDKGDYKLYFDNETGKLVYELANSAATTWTQNAGFNINGSWDTNGKRTVSSSVTMGSDVYVGLGNQLSDAEVWMWNGTTWTKIGGDDLNNSWADQTFEEVVSLTTDGTNIYAGLGSTAGDGEVWMWNGTTWTKIGGDAVNSSWQVSMFERVESLNFYGGNLYAGLGSSGNDAEVWMWNGTTWTKIGGDSLNSGWTTNIEVVSSMTNDGSNLYAGTGVTAGDGDVWRWNGTAWMQIGGDGINASWAAGTFETVRSIRYIGGTLYAGLGDSTTDAELWAYSAGTWTKIGGDGVNGSWNANYEGVYSIATDGTDIYVGLGTGNGDGEVWKLASGAWSQVGGDGLNNGWAAAEGDVVYTLTNSGTTIYAGLYDTSGGGYFYSLSGGTWTRLGGQYTNKSWGYYGQGSVEVMQVAGDYLYAGLGLVAGSAQVWQHNGTNWVIVGGQGVNGSWAENTYEQISSMSSHNGELYVGLGTTANDAEVWKFDGSVWTQIGGDSLNSGWGINFEEVNSLASYDGYLYAGLGNSGNDAEVWRWNGTTWTKIGGDSLNSGWTTNYERVASLAVFKGKLIAGLGASAGDAEVWSWNGTNWSKVGGDAVNASFDSSYEQVESLIPNNNLLYVGLGNTGGDAEVWSWDGNVTWTKVGGDDLNNSWTDGTYERVRTMASYNGDLFAGLGSSTGDGEVWKYSDGTWTKVGGNTVNSSWGSAVEEVRSFSTYKGKFYAGTGISANADPNIWTYGDNGYLESNASSFAVNWHHVAGTYDGATMKLYIDGVLDSQTTKLFSIPDSTRPLLIGNGYGGREYGKPLASFSGELDEVRISNVARTSFNSKPYLSTSQAVSPTTSIRKNGVKSWDKFTANETANGGSITYRLSDDDGASWKFWNGSDWVASSSYAQSTTQTVVNTHITAFPIKFSGVRWQAILTGNGSQKVILNQVNLESTADINPPATNASSITALKANGGTALAQYAWTNGASPYFAWTAGSDSESPIAGYCAYIGQDNSADPLTTKGLLGVSPTVTGGNCQYIVTGTSFDTATAGTFATNLSSSSSPYYLKLKAIDRSGNVSAGIASFEFKFDNTPANNPAFVSAPSGFISDPIVQLTWPITGGNAPSDAESGLAGLQYKINNSVWYGDTHSGSGDSSDLLINDGSYTTQDSIDTTVLVDGINTIYFRTWDIAGNVTSTYTTAVIKLNTSGAPSEPQNLVATPVTNTTNSFSFDWDAPATFVGDVNNITYCYVVNALPSQSSCTYTNPGSTSLGSNAYATQPGTNTLYVMAKDESGNKNYSSFSTVSFTANTPSPGIPLNADIVDVSIKSSNNWRLALTWEQPIYTGSGISNYKVYRSLNNVNFTQVGSSSSTTYIDAGLSQQTYYYYIAACDNTNNCGAVSATVSAKPTGKFTTPAELISNPKISGVTTKKAIISWATDRSSDSRVSLGTASGKYSPAEVANSTQTTDHKIDLDNLSAGTTYYFVARWTDEDGNVGSAQEYSFTTAPAPTIKEVNIVKVNLSSSIVQFTSRDAVKVDLLYGKTESFGGIITVNTSSAESTYTVDLSGLEDGTKYLFKTISYDSEGNSYSGNIFSLTTPARPRIANLRFQPVEGEPTSTQSVTWNTNVASNSIVTYGKIDTAGKDQQSSELVVNHEIVISNLEDDSEYFLVAQSRDADGNLAVSERQVFKTALDTRPPTISNIVIETSIRGTGAEARGQVIVSWTTDEPASSQVAFAEGSSASVFNNKTSEDSGLGTEHIVIVSDLPTSRVYSIQPVSRDKSANEGTGEVQTAIVGRASDSVLTIILNTLQRVFGF